MTSGWQPNYASSQGIDLLGLRVFGNDNNIRKRGKALLPALIEFLVTEDPGIQ